MEYPSNHGYDPDSLRQNTIDDVAIKLPMFGLSTKDRVTIVTSILVAILRVNVDF